MPTSRSFGCCARVNERSRASRSIDLDLQVPGGWMPECSSCEMFAYVPDEWEITDATLGGQKVEPCLFGDVFASLVPEIEGLGPDDSVVIPREYRESITINPAIRGGMPVLKGTRIGTAPLAALSARGRSIVQIARMYALSRRAVTQALAYEIAITTPATAACAGSARRGHDPGSREYTEAAWLPHGTRAPGRGRSDR